MGQTAIVARPPLIAVCGPSAPTDREEQLAYQVGSLLAGRGAVVVCGGLGGAMAAAARGAAEAGGMSLGLLPGDDIEEASEHITFALATGLGELRNGLIVRCSQAVIVVGGALGTLTELTFALRLGRPTIGLETWTLVPPGDQRLPIRLASSPEEAVELALTLSASR